MGEGFKDMVEGGMAAAKPEKEAPRLHIDLEQFPAMKGWKLGKTYALKARLVSKVEALDDRPECYDFEIVGSGSDETKPEEESADEDSKETNENDDYGNSGSEESAD